jgi:hypothetical protein
MNEKNKNNGNKGRKSEKRNLSPLLALLIMLGVGLWMFSGKIVIGGSEHDQIAPIAEREKKIGK